MSVSNIAASQGSCLNVGGVIICNIGNLATGAAAYVTILVSASNPVAQIDTLTNGAAAYSSVFDLTPFNNSGTVYTVVFRDTVGDGVPDFWRQLYFGGAGDTTNAAFALRQCCISKPVPSALTRMAWS